MDKKEVELLIVEDDQNVLETVAHELKNLAGILNEPLDVKDVDTLDQAHLYIESEDPEIVVLDVFLKDGQNTLDLVKRCNNQGLELFWIVHSTEWQYEDTRAKFAALGVHHGVNKLDFDGLKSIIAEYIKNPPKKEKQVKRVYKLHEIPIETRLEEFHDFLVELCGIDFAIQAYIEKNPSEELTKIEKNLFKYIEELRDFVLKGGE